MKRDDKNKYIEFDSDKEFEEYAIQPHYVFKTNNEGNMYYDVDLTDEYLQDMESGYTFDITDEDSIIRKHQAVTYRTITKPVKVI